MDESRKTIKMPKKLLADWLAALRSGKFQQGTGQLNMKSTGRYCCLGVMQMAADGMCEYKGLPSVEWLEAHDVVFTDVHGRTRDVVSPYLPRFDRGAHSANDFGGKDGMPLDFLKIADAIEACAEGV